MPTVLESLNTSLRKALVSDPNVVLLGEDILDPYGGAFKVTRGLSTEFPNRVITTPISEAGMVGLATGMALRGYRPVVEIMFGDFLTLIADQVINHATKFRWMYNDQVRVPLVIRTPMGGRRGYGPTHSQSLEKLFLGVPGLRLLAPCALGDPGGMLLQAILEDNDPVLFVENKLLYPLPVHDPASWSEFEISESKIGSTSDCSASYAPAYTVRLHGAPKPMLTLATYGYMSELARQAVLRLAYEQEIFVEMVVLSQLAPIKFGPLLASVRRTGKLLSVEEGTRRLGWGAEVLAQLTEVLGPNLVAAFRLAAQDLPIPASGCLEIEVLPGVNEIVEAAVKLSKVSHLGSIGEKFNHENSQGLD